MLRVGLTGGIACGKTQVLARLEGAGLHTLDLDGVAHRLMAPGAAAYRDLVAAFGPGILAGDGTIDRRALGAIAFADQAARARLNAIVHPRVWEEESRRTSRWAGDPRAVVVTDAALLVETGAHLRFDRLVVVHCSPEEQLRRLMARDAMDAAAARARIAAQMPVAEKRRFAHFEVDTSGTLEETARAADALVPRLAAEAEGRGPSAPARLAGALGCLVHGPAAGPRGLAPARLLREIAAAVGIPLAGLARLLDPPSHGPWYEAARPEEPGPSPARLAAPVVLCSLARSSPDPPYLFGAMASVARLTHRDPVSVASACLFARALLEVAVEGSVPGDLGERARRWADQAARWGGAPPDLRGVLDAAAGHPRDPAAARVAARAAGGDPELAGAVVGLAVGINVETAPAELVEDLRRLEAAFHPPRSPLARAGPGGARGRRSRRRPAPSKPGPRRGREGGR